MNKDMNRTQITRITQIFTDLKNKLLLSVSIRIIRVIRVLCILDF